MAEIESSRNRGEQLTRLGIVRYVVIFCFITLIVSFWYLQVAQYARFLDLAENNHQRTRTLQASRGGVFDRDGRVLVENRYALNISLIREQSDNLNLLVRKLAALVKVDEKELGSILELHRNEPGYRRNVVIHDASLDQVATVEAHKHELPGVVIEQVPTRYYPASGVAAHSFGYVGEITSTQMSLADFEGLKRGAVIGQSGLEKNYNRLLMGIDGFRRVVVNNIGRELETFNEVRTKNGSRLKLSLDYDLQVAAEQGFKANGFYGSAVALDPNSGEVLALVSLPSYNPNVFASGIDMEEWKKLNADELRPLQNRPIQGRYSPGSLFKIVVAVAALEEKIISSDFKVRCNGGADFYGRYFRCHLRQGHGLIDVQTALEKSCNVYFYTVGNMVGIDLLHKWGTALGLGEISGIDLPSELRGIMPSKAWKKRQTGERWYAGETVSVAIGQGQVWVTPISLAVMISTIANGGVRYVPHLLKGIDDGQGWRSAPAPVPTTIDLKPETIEIVHEGLWRVVNRAGTGGRASIEGRNVAGKTGTAQVISRAGQETLGEQEAALRDHGWFVFFAPEENPKIAGVILAEHAEHGYLAAPIARHVLQTYFAKAEGKPLPDYPVPLSDVVVSEEVAN